MMHIAIAGNIGSGKTTLTAMLAKSFKWEPHFEDADDNPYLYDFYEDIQRWSFNLQLYFLNSLNERYEAWIEGYDLGKVLIIDIDDINFEEKPEDLGIIINKINGELYGLFK